VPKVHNKPIKRPRKGFKQKSKRQPERHPGLGRCTRALEAELFTFGKIRGRSAIIHRTVRCASGATTTSRATVDCNALNARLRVQRTRSWRTGQSTGPVWCTTGQPRGPTSQSSNGRTPTVRWRGWRTGQCPVAHPSFYTSTPYKSYSIQYKTHQRDQILSQLHTKL
jgi:hypothetical protein